MVDRVECLDLRSEWRIVTCAPSFGFFVPCGLSDIVGQAEVKIACGMPLSKIREHVFHPASRWQVFKVKQVKVGNHFYG